MIRVEHNGFFCYINPNQIEKYTKSVGETTELLEDYGVIVDNFEHKQGGNFNFFLLVWEMATDEEKENLEKILLQKPTVSSPARLTWADGTKYNVVFAQIGESKCQFKEQVKDSISGKTYYKATAAFVEISGG